MPERVFISGLGVISAIGETVEDNLHSLKNQKSGISSIQFLESEHKKEFPAGEIKLSNMELSNQLGLSNKKGLPRTALFALKAASEAYKNANLENVDPQRIGFIGGTTTGGMDNTEKHYSNPSSNPSFILTHSCGYISEIVAEHLNINGYISTINTACSSSTNAILTGARLIKHNVVDIVIAGGFDALSKFTLNGFKTLLILSPEKCKPFDENRKGLNLGEGAGFVVLESERSINRRKVKAIAELKGYANTNDAFHQTASSPDGNGAFLSMEQALKKADLKPEEIDYINAHGTGTINNDLTEGIAIKRVFGTHTPPFSSTKSYIGHTLGAAGGIEAVYSILSLTENIIFSNLNYKSKIKDHSIEPVISTIENQKINNVMTNSFGFGGNDSTLIFSKV